MPLLLVVVAVVPGFAGDALLRALGLRPRADRVGPMVWIGWSLLAGQLVVGALLAAWLWFALPLRAVSFDGAVLAAAFVLHAIARHRTRNGAGLEPQNGAARIGAIAAILLAVATLTIVDAALASWMRPIASGDEAGIWAAKAKALFASGGFTARFGWVAGPNSSCFHPDYPELNPLLQVFTFLHTGPSDFANRLPSQCVAIALVFALFGAATRVAGPLLAGVATLLVATGAETAAFAATACADGLVALSALVLVDALDRVRAGAGKTHVRLAAVALATLVFSKNEGVMIGACAVAVHFATLRRAGSFGALALFALPAAAVIAFQWTVNVRFGFVNDLIGGPGEPSFLARFPLQLRARGADVLRRMGHFLADEWRVTRGLPLAFVVSCAFFPLRTLWSGSTRAGLVALLALAGEFIVYVGSPVTPEWHVSASLPRLVGQVLPLLALAVAGVVAHATSAIRPARVTRSATGASPLSRR